MTSKQLSNATNGAIWWFLENPAGNGRSFEMITYARPSDPEIASSHHGRDQK